MTQEDCQLPHPVIRLWLEQEEESETEEIEKKKKNQRDKALAKKREQPKKPEGPDMRNPH
jgi:hypothetical protein